MSEKAKIILTVFLFFLISTIGVIAYQSKDKFEFQKMFYGDKAKKSRNNIKGRAALYVKCDFLTNIDQKTLRMKVSIPCNSRKQQSDLKEKLPKIQHGFIMSISDASMLKSVKTRDFNAMKIRLLSIINSYSSTPVTNLYFEHYFLN